MEVIYSIEADKFLCKLDTYVRDRITEKIDELSTRENPFAEAKRLVGCDAFRFRVGDYRIIFRVKQQIICVARIDKRDDVYKKI